MTKSANSHLADIVMSNALPSDAKAFLEPLTNDDGTRFTSHESYLFDYKRGWFKSVKDPGAAAIIRAIAGFYNTYGGILFVGVDDNERTAGHNTLHVDIESLNSIIRATFSGSFICEHRKYSTPAGTLDCVLIPKRPAGTRPVVINKQYGEYSSGVIWKREGHEILKAASEDLALLHSDRKFGADNVPSLDRANTSIPPRIATIQQFIGRQETLHDIFDWIGKPRSPRTFLWGRGGSGKSTIAYEIAVAASEVGRELKLSGSDELDAVIFISAKKQELSSAYARIDQIPSPDFSSRRELFEALLLLLDTGEYALENIETASEGSLISQLERIFDKKSVLIVIDDIDTISTEQTSETGSEELFFILSRASRSSKIIYTQRDSPRFASSDIIEVQPLDEEEYLAFIQTCCDQFNVTLPSPSFINGELSAASERRPLIVEVVIGLARTCAGDFTKALELYNNRAGQDARRYLFEREYLHLASEVDSQIILYAIALFNSPMTMDDLQVVTRWDSDRVYNAVQPVLNMFLDREGGADQSSYEMSVPARDYILAVSESVPRRESLEANIVNHKAKRLQKGTALASLEAAVNNLISDGQNQAAWQRVESFSGTPKELANPHFAMIRTIANSHRDSPDLNLARQDMGLAMDMKCATAESLLSWIDLETRFMVDMSGVRRITEYAEKEKSIRLHEKAELFVRRARHSFATGYELRDTNKVAATEAYVDAMKYNLWAQTLYNRLNSNRKHINHEMVVKSTGAYLSFTSYNGLWDNLPEAIRKIYTDDICFFADSFIEPWLNFMSSWANGNKMISTTSVNEALDALNAFVLNPRRCYFEDETRETLIRDAIRSTRKAVKKLNASR